MNKKVSAVITTAATLAVTAISMSPAHAASYRWCSTTGANGGVTITNWTDPGATVGLSIGLNDTKADGHHVRVRILSEQSNGKVVYWPWRKHMSGADTGQTWNTSASDDRGLFEIGVQIARFEGDKMLNSCTDWS
ncbi:hypothetical protein [Streptomyces griseoflavus]|uniref:hypothetical protein n=1 Tax=Streptomyces griseoflavus TaxID=35619 RepID=UPI00167D71BE|nr:hypothetical protein [Streptomyces griseoflavus]GGV48429.1 hypothetical protein GCM10010293_58250 [Streptomyces griseoflavus]